MRILFDSHALVWFLLGDPRLPLRVREVLKEAEMFISAVSAWEIATKVARGKWPDANRIAVDFDEVLATDAYTPLPITIQHARVAGFLPGRHRDPFDRMLAAQAQVEGVTLVSGDPAFEILGVPAMW